MGRRWLLSVLTAIALLFGGMQSAAMAAEMVDAPTVVAAAMTVSADAPCHMADSVDKESPAKPDCCPGGCAGGCADACTPLAAFFALPDAMPTGFVRAGVERPVVAAAPSNRSTADERPPKISA